MRNVTQSGTGSGISRTEPLPDAGDLYQRLIDEHPEVRTALDKWFEADCARAAWQAWRQHPLRSPQQRYGFAVLCAPVRSPDGERLLWCIRNQDTGVNTPIVDASNPFTAMSTLNSQVVREVLRILETFLYYAEHADAADRYWVHFAREWGTRPARLLPGKTEHRRHDRWPSGKWIFVDPDLLAVLQAGHVEVFGAGGV